MNALKTALAVAAVGCALTGTTIAMPAANLSTSNAITVQKAAWVCGPYRCWWRPGPRYWGYGPRWAWGPRWGWYGHPYWRRWHRW